MTLSSAASRMIDGLCASLARKDTPKTCVGPLGVNVELSQPGPSSAKLRPISALSDKQHSARPIRREVLLPQTDRLVLARTSSSSRLRRKLAVPIGLRAYGIRPKKKCASDRH